MIPLIRSTPAARFLRKNFEKLLLPMFFFLVIGLWKWIIYRWDLQPFILPPPELVWERFITVLKSGSLWFHTVFTLTEAFLGFLAALIFGTFMGYILARSRLLEQLFSPYIVASRGIPVITIAPLLAIWFGFGLPSKVFVSFFIVFFPMLINTIIGIRSVNIGHRELMRAYGASRWQIFRYIEIPSAMPILLGGFKIGITSSIMGAVVGEFVSADRGLGFLVNQSKGLYDTPLMFVAIGTLAALSFILYTSVWGLEIILLRGRPEQNAEQTRF
ncbi:MAG: ABC transporter permease [Chloroflexi bacterium]|nr:ABC transporter permease [Chloroflexota bacterium]